MNKVILIAVIGLFALNVNGQGKNISLVKKSTSPIITMNGDTIRVGDEVLLLEGSNEDGSYKYIQTLNGLNEPIAAATSKMAFKKQKVKFFKEQDGTTYVFTKWFVLNIEGAMLRKEIKVTKI